jgi:hypothetical protein
MHSTNEKFMLASLATDAQSRPTDAWKRLLEDVDESGMPQFLRRRETKRTDQLVADAETRRDPSVALLDPGLASNNPMITHDVTKVAWEPSVPETSSSLLAEDLSPGDKSIEFTLIESHDTLTKTYGIDPQSGRPVKLGEPNLCNGTVRRVRLNHENPAQHFGQLLQAIGPREALATGQLADERDEAPLTTKSRLSATPGAIARTRGWSGYNPGRPALNCIDHDGGDLPLYIQDRIAAVGGFESYMIGCFPGSRTPPESSGHRCLPAFATVKPVHPPAEVASTFTYLRRTGRTLATSLSEFTPAWCSPVMPSRS